MKIKVFILIVFLPVLSHAQEQVSSQIYGFNMPIELDSDTTYNFKLDSTKCTESMYGVDENGGCDYLNGFPYLYFYHQFSLNCCTEHFYEIKINGDTIEISYSESGEHCTCGSCTYTLTYSDQNPQKENYHIRMAGKDTTIMQETFIDRKAELDDFKVLYNSLEGIILVESNRALNTKPIFVSLLNMNGVKIESRKFDDINLAIDATSLQPGLYILMIERETNLVSKKIFIE